MAWLGNPSRLIVYRMSGRGSSDGKHVAGLAWLRPDSTGRKRNAARRKLVSLQPRLINGVTYIHTYYWSEVGGHRPPPNGAYFPPAQARREGGRPGALVSPFVRSSVRPFVRIVCDLLEFLSINLMEFQ